MRPDISGAHRAVEEPGPYFKPAVDCQESPPVREDLARSSVDASAVSAALEGSSGLAPQQAELTESLRAHQSEDAAALDIDPTPAETQDAAEVPQSRPSDTQAADAASPSERSDRPQFCREMRRIICLET